MTRWVPIALAAGFVVFVGLLIGLAALVGSIVGSSSGSCGAGPSPDGQPPLIQYYIQAAARYGLGPGGYAYLAAINNVETRFGTEMAVSSAGAVGWMQFEPATWAQYGVSVSDPAAPADPSDPQDAIYTAARYLRASGAPRDWNAALYSYNHAQWYVAEVAADANRYMGPGGLVALARELASYWGAQQPPLPGASLSGQPVLVATMPPAGAGAAVTGGAGLCAGQLGPIDVVPVPGSTAVIMPNGIARPPADAPSAVQAMIAAGDRIVRYAYSWGGGHCVAAMSQTSADPAAACAGRQENGSAGYDCSGSTSYVLFGGGLGAMIGDQPQTSGTLAGLGVAGAGRWVTWMANAGHVYVAVAGIYLNTENGAYMRLAPQPPAVPSQTGPRWGAGNGVDSLTRPGFAPRHPAGL